VEAILLKRDLALSPGFEATETKIEEKFMHNEF
jgi:hypothetical protein